MIPRTGVVGCVFNGPLNLSQPMAAEAHGSVSWFACWMSLQHAASAGPSVGKLYIFSPDVGLRPESPLKTGAFSEIAALWHVSCKAEFRLCC